METVHKEEEEEEEISSNFLQMTYNPGMTGNIWSITWGSKRQREHTQENDYDKDRRKYRLVAVNS